MRNLTELKKQLKDILLRTNEAGGYMTSINDWEKFLNIPITESTLEYIEEYIDSQLDRLTGSEIEKYLKYYQSEKYLKYYQSKNLAYYDENLELT